MAVRGLFSLYETMFRQEALTSVVGTEDTPTTRDLGGTVEPGRHRGTDAQGALLRRSSADDTDEYGALDI